MGLKQYQKASHLGIIDFDDCLIKDSLIKKLSSLKTFTDNDYYSSKVREYIANNLDLGNIYWNKFLDTIFESIKKNNYIIIRGLPLDDNNRLLIGLSSILGTPVEPYQRTDTNMIRNQSPLQLQEGQDMYPHTDGAKWIEPNDLTAIQFVRNDQNGGALSRIIPIDNLLEHLIREGFSELIDDLLKTQYPFPADNELMEKGWMLQNILSREIDGYHVRFSHYYIHKCINEFGINVDQRSLDNVKLFEKEAMKMGLQRQFEVVEGDLLIFDNKRTLHSRSISKDKSKRLIKKIKINIDRENLFF
jgi:hypothetical protein